jgi:hypothetical protein
MAEDLVKFEEHPKSEVLYRRLIPGCSALILKAKTLKAIVYEKYHDKPITKKAKKQPLRTDD